MERGIHGENGPTWELSGQEQLPTIRASVLVQGGPRNQRTVCHSFVTEGRIHFLGDSTHNLSGQTVLLPDLNESQQ